MKIKSNLSAGMTFAECDQQRNWWKEQAEMMERYFNDRSLNPPAGLWFPCPPSTTPPTVPPTSGGGWVNGVFFPDKSGVCGASPTPPTTPPTTGGGWVNGQFFPDRSGVC